MTNSQSNHCEVSEFMDRKYLRLNGCSFKGSYYEREIMAPAWHNEDLIDRNSPNSFPHSDAYTLA